MGLSQEPRLLRVLVIHDYHVGEANILGTEDLALCRYQLRERGEIRILRSWIDVVALLTALAQGPEVEDSLDVPDLMLIDCNFETDHDAPRLVHNIEFDPRGLLYGAVLAAHFLGANRQRAFAFVPYSKAMEQASPDPYGQTFYSLLSAMLEKPPEVIEPIAYSLRLSKYDAQAPKDVVGTVLPRYREHLEELFADSVYPESDTFETALANLDAAVGRGEAPPRDLSVAWRGPDGEVSRVLLRSLFADLPDCLASTPGNGDIDSDREACPLRAFLNRILELYNYSKFVLRPTESVLESIRSSDDTPNWGSGLEKDQRRVMALAIRWATDRCTAKYSHREPAGVSALNDSLGLHPTQSNRALGAVFIGTKDVRYSLDDFVKRLDEASRWPFPSRAWLPRLTTKHLQELYRGGERPDLAPEFWPGCLQAFAD